MKVLTPGHLYELDNSEGHDIKEHIQFIQKEEVNGELKTICNGTTNEEVLRVLIDRLKFLNGLMPSHYNESAISGLMAVLKVLEQRTEERKARGVEGTPKP